MTQELDALYQEIILDHYKNPHHKGLREPFEAEVHHVNPTCGDEITLQLHLDGDRVARIAWTGHGCAISQASASLLTELAVGLTIDELSDRIDTFREALRSRGTIELDEDVYGDAAVLSGVSKYIARVKCAMLAWVAAEHTIARARG